MAPSREYPERPVVGIGGVIIDGGRALLIRRGSEPLRGEWSIPGGTLELGETLEEGAAREAQEEAEEADGFERQREEGSIILSRDQPIKSAARRLTFNGLSPN